MYWKKIGKIFDPFDYNLPNDCISHAQSPQTLVFDDFIRVYFSTRAEDISGKFISHVAYVDFTKDMKTILKVSNHEILPPGELGTFDEHGIFPISPLRDANRIFAYTTGWTRRKSVSVNTGIGLVESLDNGETFQRASAGPVLSASLHEPFLVCDGFVKKIDEKYHMWYIFGTAWATGSSTNRPERTYKIAHATSHNGRDWSKKEGQQIINDKLGKEECQALPSVIKINSCYHMVFAYRESFDFRTNRSRGYRIGHAWSNDLQNWHRDDTWINFGQNSDQWDSDMQCYPHIFQSDDTIYLLYNGNDFGKKGFGLAELIMSDQ